MEEEGKLNSGKFKLSNLVRDDRPHSNCLDVEFKALPDIVINGIVRRSVKSINMKSHMKVIVIPLRIKHGCYQELNFLNKTFKMQLN